MFFNNENFKILNITNKKNAKTELTSNEYKKYSKILNNLLGINSRSDYAIFTKLNSMNLDLLKIIKEESIHTIFSKSSFKIKLERKSPKITSSSYIKTEDESLFINKWKRYIKQVNEIYSQTNMWPLFIGTYFLKGKLGDKTIYAPLVLREVEIIIEDNNVYLTSRSSSVSLNDKLIFLLEEFQGITIPNINDEIEKISFDEVISELNKYLNQIIDFESFEIEKNFKEINSLDVNNTKICRTSGIVLLFAHPLGGILRNVVIELIKENRINNLIKIDFDKINSSDDESIKNIVYKPIPIARICPTDPSQENAIISALNDHTIIIGPPGTGKSQTIANILANILKQNKKALFISQKRIALEVVLERMKSLQYFTLQLVDHKNKSSINEKMTFYSYMENFVNLIKNSTNSKTQENENQIKIAEQNLNIKPLISYEKLQYWKSKNIENIDQNDIEIFCQLKKQNTKINKVLFKKLNEVFNELKQMSRFDEIEKIFDKKENKIKDFANNLNVPPKFKILGIKVWDKTFRNFFNTSSKLLNICNEYNLNKELILILKDYSKYSNLIKLEESFNLHENQIPKNNPFNSDEKSIQKIVALRAREIYRQIHLKDPTWIKKFNGRIERKYAQPSKFVSLFKNELKQLFNIYVSTPETLSSFIDFKNDHFDYVIFDEASQIFLEKAIPFISIADKIIVAGDDQQMQPSNWFGYRIDVDEDEKEEENIDSLLTYAIENGINKEVLELNYRSTYATLTTFSSKEFYGSNLKTLDNNILNKSIPIEVINVNGIWKNNQNEIEANKTIEVLKENIDKYEKIIILTLNKQQMDLINNFISVQEPEIYNRIINEEIVLKNLENIQGDEADLVIISIAYTKDASLSATYVGRPGGRNALNVAITRAKNKMIVIKSINSNEIQTKTEMNKDLRTFKNWVEFLELKEVDQKTYSIIKDNNVIKDVESNFEQEVVLWLQQQKFNRHLKLSLQYPIGSYRIDVALLDANTDQFILGIEVDGFLYHGSIRQRYNDLIRQNFIESKGYKLIRVSELLWKTNKSKVKLLIDQNL